MLRIRRRIPPLRAACLAAALLAGGAHAADLPQSSAPGAARPDATDDALRMLMRPAVLESIAAWGLSPDEVLDEVERLSDGEITRVVDEARRLSWRDWRDSARYQAMYLVLVAEVRGSLLFARVLTRLGSTEGDAPALAIVRARDGRD